MTAVEFVARHTWSSELPICVLNVTVAELSKRLGFPLLRWEEDGLGGASGFACRLPSGLVLKVEELAHARKYLGAQGPTVYMEASALLRHGVEGALAIVLDGLGLVPKNVVWSQTAAVLNSPR